MMDYFLSANSKLSGKLSLRKKFSRRGSLPAESLSCMDLTSMNNNNHVGSSESLNVDCGAVSPSPEPNSSGSRRLAKFFSCRFTVSC